jgi:glycosyltransferase involved in cell wall biosynthesis
MYKGQTVSVVMPAYNESDGVYETVRGFVEHPYVDEVIVVDNNSSDNTAARAVAASARVVCEPRQGYGFACRTALEHARGELIVLTESDDSFCPDDLEILCAYVSHFDIVKGARSNRHLIQPGADWTFALMFGNWLVAKYMQLLYFGTGFMDNMNQREVGGTFRVMRREAYEVVRPHLREGQSAFLPDMTTIAIRKGLRIIEVPVRYRRRLGESKITGSRVKATRLAIRMAWIITRNRFKRLVSPGTPIEPATAAGDVSARTAALNRPIELHAAGDFGETNVGGRP